MSKKTERDGLQAAWEAGFKAGRRELEDWKAIAENESKRAERHRTAVRRLNRQIEGMWDVIETMDESFCKIDAEKLAAAREDPLARQFAEFADSYVKRLREQGRIR